MKSKAEFRKYARGVKKQLDMTCISEIIQSRIIDLDCINNAECVMLYMPIPDEIDTSMIFKKLTDDGKHCCFPVVEADNIIIRNYDEKGFKTGVYGISEPLGDIVERNAVDVVVVPGIMFDEKLNRLGRGGGYYDRLLPYMRAKKIGVCPDLLVADSLPTEEHDAAVDLVVTEKRMIGNG